MSHVWQPHSDKQQLALLSDKRFTVVGTGIQWGKGVPLSHKVLTPEGYVDAGTIKQGDLLIDRDGLPTKVVGVFPQGVRPCYRISFCDGKSIVTDDQHLNVIIPRSGRPERIITTQALFESSLYPKKARVPACKPITMPTRDLLISPYIMGVILGNGYLSNGIKIEKFVPAKYLYADIEQRLALLQGLMDTDGTAKKHQKMEYYSTSLALADAVIWLVESLGGKAWKAGKQTKYTYKGEKLDGKPCWRVNVIMPFFSPFSLGRKNAEYFVHKNTADKVIEYITQELPQETVCFKVDSPTSTFIAQDQVVTHNSEVGAIRLLQKVHEFTDPRDTFLVTAPTFKVMKQATLPTFLEMVPDRRFGKYHAADALYKINGGGTIYFRTGHIPDSIVGIRRCRHIWADEGGLYSLYFWENLQGRAAPKQATIDITTSPYAMNWVWKELVKPGIKGERDDVLVVQARSDENPYFPAAEFEARRKTMDPRRFAMIFGGEFGRPEGIVYDCYDEDLNQIDADDVPKGLRIFAGVDWGYTEPFAVVIFGVIGEHIFVLHEIKRSRLSPSQVKEIIEQNQKIFGVEHWFADPSQPAMIQEMNGIRSVSMTGATNDIWMGVGKVYERIKSRRVKFVRGRCKHMLDELETYRYPDELDDKPDASKRDLNPIGKDDHCLDALRYGLVMVDNLINVRPIYSVSETPGRMSHRERLAMITSDRRNQSVERWD